MPFLFRFPRRFPGLVAGVISAAACLLASAATAQDQKQPQNQSWAGGGVTVEADPTRGGPATLRLGGPPLPATATPAADGSLAGVVTLGRDRHAWSLGPANASGQRTLRIGGQAVVVSPSGRPSPLDPPARGPAGGPAKAAKPATPANSATPATVKLRRTTLTDTGVGNMPSHTVLVPEGWKVEGGAWWAGQAMHGLMPSHDVSVTSPEGVAVELSPEISFKFFEASPQLLQMGMQPQQAGQVDSGFPVMPMPQGPEGWKRWIREVGMPQAHPDATGVEVREIAVVPELQPMMQQIVGPIQQMIAGQNQQNRQLGMAGGGSADGCFYATHVLFDRGGKRWEQLGIVGVFWMESTSEVGRQWWWSLTPGRTFTVPEGEFEQHLPVLVAIADSLQTTPQWARMKAEHAAAISGIRARGAAEIAEITRRGMESVRRTHQETSDIIAGGYDPNAGMNVHRKVVNSINEVDDYVVGDGSTVQLPSGYDHVYSNGNNEFLLTNDHLNTPDLTVWKPIPAVP